MDWLSIIALVVALASIAGFIYTLGFKLGQITKSLEYFDPKELGGLIAKVDILWARFAYFSSSEQSSNPTNNVKTVDTLKAIARISGIEIIDAKIYREQAIATPELGGELVPISEIDEIVPNTRLFIELTLEYKRREIKMSGTFNIDNEMKVNPEQFRMTECQLFPEEAKSKQLSNKIYAMFSGYAEVVSKTLPSLIVNMVKTKTG